MPRRVVRMDEGFGERLRGAMERRGIKPGQLARALKVLPGTVSRWRRGECPDDLRFPDIAGYLQVPLDWLKTGEGGFSPEAQGPVPRSPGRRAEDLELRATAKRKDAARLDVIARLIRAYRDAGKAPGPGTLDEWLEILADNENHASPPGAPSGGAHGSH